MSPDLLKMMFLSNIAWFKRQIDWKIENLPPVPDVPVFTGTAGLGGALLPTRRWIRN